MLDALTEFNFYTMAKLLAHPINCNNVQYLITGSNNVNTQMKYSIKMMVLQMKVHVATTQADSLCDH